MDSNKQSLPNSAIYMQSFPLLSYSRIAGQLTGESGTISPTEVSNKRITNPLQTVLINNFTHPLIFNCLIALSCCYLEQNAYKSFTNSHIINNNNHQIRVKFNEIFLRYNLSCLKELQLIISNITQGDNFNIGIAGSILLNFISFYDDNLTSLTFSNGLLQLIKDSPELPRERLSEYPLFIENLSLFSKSYYFPDYYWKCLIEFKEIMEKFQRFISHDYIFTNYHFLNQFLNKVLQVVSPTNEQANLSNNPSILKKLLQDWLIILPSNIHLLGKSTRFNFNDQEVVLLLLFKCLGKMLDNIFPRVMFFNLHTFGASYNSPLIQPQQLQSISSSSSSSSRLSLFINYCLKVYDFFDTRMLVLHNLLLNNNSKIPQFITSVNEIPLIKFNNVSIEPYNYLHFPEAIQLSVDNLSSISQYFKNNNGSMYVYNTHHAQHFKYCFLTSPDIQFHAFNRGLRIPNSWQINSISDKFTFRDTVFASYNELIMDTLTKSYEGLFKGKSISPREDGLASHRKPSLINTHDKQLFAPTPIFVILLKETKYQDGELIQWLKMFDNLRKLEIEQISSTSSM